MPTCQLCFTDYTTLHSDSVCLSIIREQRDAAARKIFELLQYLPDGAMARADTFLDLPWLRNIQ